MIKAGCWLSTINKETKWIHVYGSYSGTRVVIRFPLAAAESSVFPYLHYAVPSEPHMADLGRQPEQQFHHPERAILNHTPNTDCNTQPEYPSWPSELQSPVEPLATTSKQVTLRSSAPNRCIVSIMSVKCVIRKLETKCLLWEESAKKKKICTIDGLEDKDKDNLRTRTKVIQEQELGNRISSNLQKKTLKDHGWKMWKKLRSLWNQSSWWAWWKQLSHMVSMSLMAVYEDNADIPKMLSV